MKVVIGSRPDYWNSRVTFILAGMSAAVGLANIWKFPYLLGLHGSAFFFAYFMALFLLGLPLFALEVSLGRSQAGNPYDAMRSATRIAGGSAWWAGIGILSIFASLLVFALYLVVGGIVLAYVFLFAFGHFQNASPAYITEVFRRFQEDPGHSVYWMSMFWVMTLIVSAKGMHRGVARAVRMLMPICVILLVVLFFYSAELPSFNGSLHYLLGWKGGLSYQAWVDAFSQAFFSLSLCMGVMLTLGSYMPRQMPMVRSLFLIALLDLIFALLAGLTVLPMLSENGLSLDFGFSLLFQSLPVALSDTAFERGIGVALFVMFVLAAWGSTILVMEPTVAFLNRRFSDERRFVSVLFVGTVGWCMAYLAIRSFSDSSLHFQNIPLFSWYDNLTSRFLLPAIGLGFSLYAGWLTPKARLSNVLHFSQQWQLDILRLFLRWFVPALICFIVFQRT